MFLALLWSYEYNEHVQNLEPSTKNLQKSTSIWALACLDMPGLDTKRPNTEILQNLEFKILCSHARISACRLHCHVFVWNPLETSLFRRLEAKTCKLQTCCIDSTIPCGRIMVQWQYHMSHIESYLKSSIAVTQQELTRIKRWDGQCPRDTRSV